MKLNKRKGFTIVELVIVIAVIAILAAVLIPNISNLVKKANASADESLVRNLNTALSMDVEKHQTMDAALEAAKTNGGYELTTIVTKNKDNKILWDSKNDCFVYLNGNTIKYLPNTKEDKTVTDVDYFEIVELKDGKVPDSKYSAYLAGESVIPKVEAKLGLDVGKNTVAEVVFETNESVSVLINTNGGKLTVNAGKANVTHRGDASIVTIEAVAKESYHENGKVNEIKLKDGRVVVEAKAEVGSILVTAEEANKGKVKIDVMDSATLGAIGAEKFDIKATTDIITGADKTEVVVGKVDNSKFAGGFGTEKAPYLIATADDFLNIKSLEKEMETKSYFFVLLNDIDLTTVKVGSFVANTFNGALNGNGHSILVNPSQFYMFKYAVNDVVIENLTYTLNGTNAMVFFNRYATTATEYDATTKLYTTINDTVNLTFRNITINGQSETYHQFLTHNYGLLTSCQSYLEVLNAKTVGGILSGDSESYYACTSETKNCRTNTVIENCVVNANLSGSSTYNAVLLGGQTESINQVMINGVTYNGTFIGTQVGIIFSNVNGSLEDTSLFDIKNVKLTGTLIYTPASNAMAGISFANNTYEFAGVANQGTISQLTIDNAMKITLTNSRYTLAAAEDAKVSKYNVSIKLSALKFTDSTYTADLGEASTNNLIIEVVPGELEIYKAKNLTKHQAEAKNIELADDWKISVNGLRYQFVNSDNQWYLVIDYSSNGQYREFKNTEVECVVTVYAYDQSNQLLHIAEEK